MSLSQTPKKEAQLKLFNSLSQKKEPFVPNKGNEVSWYCCGPTVYDAAHMGHARSYISFDIIRRVLVNYFHYNVTFVMNITDIDDKIIVKARKEFLWKRFSDGPQLDRQAFEQLVGVALQNLESIASVTPDPDLKKMRQQKHESLTKKLDMLRQGESWDPDWTMDTFKDVISDYLDKMEGGCITDPEIFFQLTRRVEASFLEDMKALNILPPTHMPRVSECIPEVIRFVEKLIANGYAYESNGSVYFNTNGFMKTHKYAKLVPSAVDDVENLAAGEGELTTSNAGEKKSCRDFVLWKRSKSGEPFWTSPWGNGRPGWHIECSTMCDNLLPNVVDIHSGGVDLKFPHHDNEIAQSEAYYETQSWVNVFLHTGHLTIAGCKMSKSLKNFITIGNFLAKFSHRQIRVAFLLHQWNGPLDLSENMMEEACALDLKLAQFLTRVQSLIRVLPQEQDLQPEVYSVHHKELLDALDTAERKVHDSICDNIDTPAVLLHIKVLMSAVNNYSNKVPRENLQKSLIASVLHFMNRTLETFGASYIGDTTQSQPSQDDRDLAFRLATAASYFRSEIRAIAKAQNNAEILKLCDHFRDVSLFDLGVKVEDSGGSDQKPTVVLTTREQLLLERESVAKAEQTRKQKAEQSRQQQLEQADKKLQKAAIHPSKIFLHQTDKYSSFDQNGVPTCDVQGNPLSKSALKKILKKYEEQKVLYEKYCSEHARHNS